MTYRRKNTLPATVHEMGRDIIVLCIELEHAAKNARKVLKSPSRRPSYESVTSALKLLSPVFKAVGMYQRLIYRSMLMKPPVKAA